MCFEAWPAGPRGVVKLDCSRMSSTQSANRSPRKARATQVPDQFRDDIEALRELAYRCLSDPALNDQRIELVRRLFDRIPSDQFPEVRGSLMNDLGQAYS